MKLLFKENENKLVVGISFFERKLYLLSEKKRRKENRQWIRNRILNIRSSKQIAIFAGWAVPDIEGLKNQLHVRTWPNHLCNEQTLYKKKYHDMHVKIRLVLTNSK